MAVEMENNSKRKWKSSRARNQKLSLEDYLTFLYSNDHFNLTVNLLNQIISMYGYKKIHKTAKKVLLDAVNSLVPVNPSRSTLKDNSISPVTLTSLDDTIADLKELNWQECCVTSIEYLYSSNNELIISDEIPSDPTSLQHHHSDSVRAPEPPVKIDRRAKKLTPKRKRTKLSAICCGTGGSSGGSENALALDCVSFGSC